MTTIVLGAVVKPVGLRGEVKLRTSADYWDAALQSAGLRALHAGSQRTVRVLRSRPHGPGAVIVTIEGVGTREDAAALVGSELILEGVPADVAPPPELRGFQVRGMRVRTRDGEEIGRVADVMHLPAHDVLVVRSATREHLVPHVPAIVIETDAAAGEIRIDPPAGLLEL